MQRNYTNILPSFHLYFHFGFGIFDFGFNRNPKSKIHPPQLLFLPFLFYEVIQRGQGKQGN